MASNPDEELRSMIEDLSFVRENNTVYAVVNCHASTSLLEEDAFVADFQESEFNQSQLKSELIPDFIEGANAYIEKVQEELEEPSPYRAPIAEVIDALITISVSRDKMSAKAKVEAAWGGEHINLDKLKVECTNAGVKFGVKRSKVAALLDKVSRGNPGDVFEDVIALGKEPKNGKNAFFKPLVELFSDRIRKPTQLEDGKVDLKDLGDIETVKPGEKIYQKIPFTFGIDGSNVLGEVLKAAPGKDAKLEESAGTVIDPENKNVLLAKKEGLARLIETRMEVDDVYTLAELTPKQGHVKFNGSVVILGDVAPEMKIIASGDVLIGGYVEAASIRCKGELTVLSGVSGKPLDEPNGKRQNNCLLESSHRVNISFANHVDIFAKRDVFVHKQISHCNLKAASLVVGKGATPQGKIIGGNYLVSKFIEAGAIGAPSDTDTHISMNRTYQVFKEKEAHFWQQVEEQQEKVEGWNAKLATLHQEDKKQAVKFEISQLEEIIDKNNHYRKTLLHRRREYMSQVFVKANHCLHGGLHFKFGSKAMVNERQTGPSIVRLDEYKLVIEPKV